MYAWQFNGIKHFTADEVRNTGACLKDVKRQLLVHLSKFRSEIGRPVALLPNGMTTGKHKSWTHREGLAVDIAFYDGGGPIYPVQYTMMAIACGFRGIGWYWNGTALSAHLDLGTGYRQWGRWRHHGEPYSANRTVALIHDLRVLEERAR